MSKVVSTSTSAHRADEGATLQEEEEEEEEEECDQRGYTTSPSLLHPPLPVILRMIFKVQGNMDVHRISDKV